MADEDGNTTGDLVKRCAEAFLAQPELFDRLDQLMVATLPPDTSSDPALVAAIAASNRSNDRHWLRSLARDPMAPVPANTAPDVLDPVSDVVRRGLELQSLDGYRVGQHLLLSAWTQVVLETLNDAARALQVLRVTQDSLADFVAATMLVLLDTLTQAREDLTGDVAAERLRTAAAVLDGAPLADSRAEALLRYRLSAQQCAAIIWDTESALTDLQQHFDSALRSTGGRSPLIIRATRTTLWAWWVPTEGLGPARVAEMLQAMSTGGAAVGPVGVGRPGFVRSHLRARDVQNLVMQSKRRAAVTCYDDIQAIIVATADRGAAEEMVRETLGPKLLESGGERQVLREFLLNQSNASRTGALLGLHRNTVQARVERAIRLLPRGDDTPPLQLELALELAEWVEPVSRASPS